MRAPAPAWAADLNDQTIELARATLGGALDDAYAHVGEIQLWVKRDQLVDALRLLRDTPGLEYQQLMEIAGVDYPERPERFEVVYCLLSLTRNHRLHVHVTTDEEKPVPSVTGLWPVAGWLEREVFDFYGVIFTGNKDLRRILTDYGFSGHPLRKDFPLTGYVEMRYSEEDKRVVYQPVSLSQDLRNWDFLSPWEGASYVLPGDEKGGAVPQAKGAPTAATATQVQQAGAAQTPSKAPAGSSGSYAKGENQSGNAEPYNKPADPAVIPTKGEGQNQ